MRFKNALLLLTFFARPALKSKATKWMNKLMHKGVIASEDNRENCNELQLVDAALNIILKEGADGSNMKAGNEQLEALEIVKALRKN
ncbi:hypothetical protein Ahy_A07g032775 [Arachis hypogaea]|uniref:Uncharacterized protein n=1 Tax=Arachis hypogaea TaxID=3818 RepID=A0A445C7M3_ARAHY|nr:hypothetical protein Ahy_A07g032775 [Arachis hypogaea]